MNGIATALGNLGEFFAAGYFELPEALPIRRWSRAVRRRFENRKPAPYQGGKLYPRGTNGGDESCRMLRFSYSSTWNFNQAAWEQVVGEQAGAETEMLENVGREFRELDAKRARLHTIHTVGGNGYTHSIPNYGRVLAEGLDGYEHRATASLSRARNAGDGERIAFLEGMLDVICGIRVWHGKLLAELESQRFSEAEKEENRLRIVTALRQVPFRPAQNFFEAFVAYHLVFYLDDCDNPGRVDFELLPFYEEDLAKGVTDVAEAEALFREFWLDVDANSGWSCTIGGSDWDGNAAYNDLTLACLRAARGLRRPNLQLRIRRDMPDVVWEEALETLMTGTGLPALHNEEEFSASLRKTLPDVDPRDFALINGGGCTETMIHGKSNVGSLDAGLNLPAILVEGLRQSLPVASSFADVCEAYRQGVRAAVREMVGQVNENQKGKGRWQPQPMRSLLIDDCLDRGIDYNAGGARYNWSVINVAGLANVVDSLAAVREVVFEKGEISGAQLDKILADDFAGHESLRTRLERCPRFGNDDEEVNGLARELSEFVFEELLAYAPWRGGKFVGSCLMFVTYAAAGKGVGATPDGRRAGAPIADSAGPVQGRDCKGPTASIKSLKSIPHYLAPGTLVVNARFARKMFSSGEERARLRSLIETYFQFGGMQLQVNVFDQELLRDACAHPENYPNLVVRMGGYSEYFSRLTPELRETLLERTEMTL